MRKNNVALFGFIAASVLSSWSAAAVKDADNTPENRIWYVSTDTKITDHADAAQAGSLAATLEKMKGAAGVVVLRGPVSYRVEKKVIVPKTVRLDFHPGAVLQMEKKALVDIQGFFGSVEYQIFDGPGTVFVRNAPFVSPQWFGAKGDGVQDDTLPIQNAIRAAAQMFNQAPFPPAGTRYSPPIVIFQPGSYRLTSTLDLYMGITLSGIVSTPYTVGHTRLMMDTQGTDKNIIHITRFFAGNRIAAQATVMIQDLEFWYVTKGKNTMEPAGGPGYGNDEKDEPINKGNAIFIDEPIIDTRIKRCNFFQSPDASIRIVGSSNPKDSKYRNLIIDECEFDSGNRFIRANDVDLDLVVNDSKFFSGTESVRIEGCSGMVTFNDSYFEHESRIAVAKSDLKQFNFVGNHHDASREKEFLAVDRSAVVNISSNTFGPTKRSTVHVTDADGGVISNNVFTDAGLNPEKLEPKSSANDDASSAAIRMVGSKNVVVSGNSVVTSGGNFSGFGIYSRDGRRKSSGNLMIGNKVSQDYAGAKWRNQNRRVNASSEDKVTGSEN